MSATDISTVHLFFALFIPVLLTGAIITCAVI